MQGLITNFESFRLVHVPVSRNRYAYVLATMASKMGTIGEEKLNFEVNNKLWPYLKTCLVAVDKWREDIKENIKKMPKSPIINKFVTSLF